MNRPLLRRLVLLLPILTLGLTIPPPASAGSAPPPLATLTAVGQDTEAIPPGILTDPAIDILDRLVLRYETVHFGYDSSVLLPAGRSALLRKARWLRAHPSAAVIVEGHCDARGSSAYNLRLGALRAEAVRAFLIEQGLAPQRIRIVSWGKERPDAAGSDERAWSRNRRAEFLLP